MRQYINHTAYTDIHNSNVPSLGLEQQHEQLCSNTLRDAKIGQEHYEEALLLSQEGCSLNSDGKTPYVTSTVAKNDLKPHHRLSYKKY